MVYRIMSKLIIVLFMTLGLSAPSFADEQKTKAIIGGGVGGAIGAAVGDELGDRNGAIIGSAVGAAIGTAVATSDVKPHSDGHHIPVRVEVDVAATHPPSKHTKGRHCPPGQAKKGRC
jgi:hypothetical protein